MRVKLTIAALLLFFLTGCPVPGIRAYQPLPKWESKFYVQARRDVFPDDVRQRPADYAKTLVVWTGVIKELYYGKDQYSRVAYFSIEHRFFDWIEDRGAQREIFFLSPKGEGMFALAWRADEAHDQKFIEQFEVGDMIVAYGYPSEMRGPVVGFHPVANIRAIKPAWFRSDVLEYGRPGQPVKRLKEVVF